MFYIHPYYGSHSRTIVISDSEYQAIRRAEAYEYVRQLESKKKRYQECIDDIDKMIDTHYKKAGLLPESNHDQSNETSEALRESSTSKEPQESEEVSR